MPVQPYPYWDLNFIIYLQNHLTSWVPFLKIVSIVISPPTMFVIAMVLFITDKKKGVLCLIYLALATFLALALKDIVHHPRVYWTSPYVTGYISPRDYGMPSGHTLFGFFLVFTAILYRKVWLVSLSVIALFLVALSRMTLGAHYVEQVLAGLVLGILIGITTLSLPKFAGLNQFNFKGKILVLSVISLLGLIVFTLLYLEFGLYFKPRPEWAAMVSHYTPQLIHEVNYLGIGASFLFSFSLLLALLLEKQFIDFVSGSFQIKSVFVGTAIVGFYVLGLGVVILLCTLWSKALAILVASFFIPYLFCFHLLLEATQLGVLSAKRKLPIRLERNTLSYRFRKLYVRSN